MKLPTDVYCIYWLFADSKMHGEQLDLWSQLARQISPEWLSTSATDTKCRDNGWNTHELVDARVAVMLEPRASSFDSFVQVTDTYESEQ